MWSIRFLIGGPFWHDGRFNSFRYNYWIIDWLNSTREFESIDILAELLSGIARVFLMLLFVSYILIHNRSNRVGNTTTAVHGMEHHARSNGIKGRVYVFALSNREISASIIWEASTCTTCRLPPLTWWSIWVAKLIGRSLFLRALSILFCHLLLTIGFVIFLFGSVLWSILAAARRMNSHGN